MVVRWSIMPKVEHPAMTMTKGREMQTDIIDRLCAGSVPAMKIVSVVMAPRLVAEFQSDGVIRKAGQGLRFMLGWDDATARDYIGRKGWKASILATPTPRKLLPWQRRQLERTDMDGQLEFDLMCGLDEGSWLRLMRLLCGHGLVVQSDHSSAVFQITAAGRAALAAKPEKKRTTFIAVAS
jgi:hypothetical protein